MDSISNTPLNDTAISTKEKVDWLHSNIAESIDYMRKERNKNSKRASFLKIATIAMSGAGALLLGLQISGFDALFRNLAFALITIVTLVNALEPFFNYRALWIEQEKALAGFHRINNELDFYLAGTKIDQVTYEKLNQLYGEFREVWEQHNNAWLTHRKADTSTHSSII